MSPPQVPRYNVLGVGVSALTLAGARDLIVGARGQRGLGYVCLCTVHGLGEARKDPEFRRILNQSWLTTPDGMPVVWMGPASVERVYGPDLMLAVCEAGRGSGLRHFFYGGNAGVAAELASRLSVRFPGLQVAGFFSPPFRDLSGEELGSLRSQVAAARPDIVWVGLGTPKQERFMAGQGMSLDTALLIGVGAAFDFHAGRVPQAPRWVQRCGLEWLFRLCVEPRRLARRYLTTNPLFIARVAAQKMGFRNYPLT
jgi:N-acetylglucosaminyldiphosphoundecaprenol N-acetyl-beta-D-mannosaminyltransferase